MRMLEWGQTRITLMEIIYLPVRNQVKAMNLCHEDISWDHVELDESKEGKHYLETHEGIIEKMVT
jgi:hypothetical protein